MGVVHKLEGNYRQRGGLDGNGDGPHDGDMRNRVTALETRFDTILPSLSTKADIEGVRSDIHRTDAAIKAWMLGTIVSLLFGFGGLIIAGGTLLNSNLQSIKTDVQRVADHAEASRAAASSEASFGSPANEIRMSPEALQAILKAKPAPASSTPRRPQ
jgi:hypothetical protein